MFSYAGYALPDALHSNVAGWIEDNINPSDVYPLAYRSWPGSLAYGPILNNTPEEPEPIRINSLKWPVGASRFARANFVVDEATLDLIRATVYKNGTPRTRPFIFDDGTSSVTTDLWMLPAIPLQQASPSGMYLLSLVDDRYYWHGIPITIAISAGVTTWANLYTDIGTALGVTVNHDTVDADYSTPPVDYEASEYSLAAVFDAIAFSVGQRVVRSFDGTVSVQNVTTANTILTANLSAALVPYCGGEMSLDGRF